MNHIISIYDFNGYVIKSTLATSSRSSKEKKRLELGIDPVNKSITFTVLYHQYDNEEISTFENIDEAIGKYNNYLC